METNTLYNGTVFRALTRNLADGESSLDEVPGLLKRMITENMWQEYTVPESGKLVTFERFEEFVTTPPLEGLGTTMEVLRALCQRHEDVLVLLDRITRKTLEEHGGDRRSESKVTCNVETPEQRGNKREYTVARLERDGHQELAQQVINRVITAAEARRQVGWEPRRVEIRLDDPDSAARTILKHMDRAAINELVQKLSTGEEVST